MTKVEKIAAFDPNGVGFTNANIFGLPFNYEESEVIIIPVPWDLTVSYLSGTANGPQAIFEYSPQIDLFDFDFNNAWKAGFYMMEVPSSILETNNTLRSKAESYISFLESGGNVNDDTDFKHTLNELNDACSSLLEYVKSTSEKILNDNKTPIIVGGEHAVPLGLMLALDEQNSDWGILQIDAHADLRKAYEGFQYSHASIMYNALKNCKNLSKIVSVGVRDLCQEEYDRASSEQRIKAFYWHEIVKNRFSATKKKLDWDTQCTYIIDQLPDKVYISFDIDGLSPDLCPNTGTPVAGGLTSDEAFHLITKLVDSGKTIIGADLCEVSTGQYPIEDTTREINANVGARVLYKLCCASVSYKKEL